MFIYKNITFYYNVILNLSLISSLVISPAHEPLAGWTDNYFGPVTLVATFFNGLSSFIWADSKCIANLVPVDKTINALIVAAWDVFNKPKRYDLHLTKNEKFADIIYL